MIAERLVIAGSRSLTSWQLFQQCMQQTQFATPLVVLSGHARGIDRLAIKWANDKGIATEHYPAQWNVHGRKAGFVRNSQMIDHANGLLAIWDSYSRGTEHAIGYARKET